MDAVRDLSPSSKVALIFTNRRSSSGAESVEGVASSNVERVVAEIEASEVSAGDGAMSEALSRARQILEKTPNPNREIYVVTDLQKLPWKDVKPDEGKTPYPVVVLDCSTRGYRNVAVVDATVAVRRYEHDNYGMLRPEELTETFRMAWSL